MSNATQLFFRLTIAKLKQKQPFLVPFHVNNTTVPIKISTSEKKTAIGTMMDQQYQNSPTSIKYILP